MAERSKSAVGIVILGLAPVIFGGPVWAIAAFVLGAIGLFEYQQICSKLDAPGFHSGYLAVAGGVLIAVAGWTPELWLLPFACNLIVASTLALRRHNAPRSFLALALETAGTAWLGLPLLLAVATRGIHGSISAHWLGSVAGTLSPWWDNNSRGLAWLLFVITVTWLSDTGAYLVGRAIGKTPLIPSISPKKTREGLLGGVLGGVACGLVANAIFGLDVPLLAAAAVALVLVVAGVLGDLVESLMKRQAGVKDSGSIIPGHGGMLDRIDALLFTWMAGYYLARLCDRWWA
jgi:phosphatidate cytidylyltransferase